MHIRTLNQELFMPQLVKGGKYVFGWTFVHPDGKILIPPEAQSEYGFKANDKLIVMSGSKTSRGFAITTINKIFNTPIFNRIKQFPELYSFRNLEDGYLADGQKIYTWIFLMANGHFKIHPVVLQKFSVNTGDRLIVGRGSGLALAFIKQGTIINEALKHPELQIFR
jgi:hypothetical protein